MILCKIKLTRGELNLTTFKFSFATSQVMVGVLFFVIGAMVIKTLNCFFFNNYEFNEGNLITFKKLEY